MAESDATVFRLHCSPTKAEGKSARLYQNPYSFGRHQRQPSFLRSPRFSVVGHTYRYFRARSVLQAYHLRFRPSSNSTNPSPTSMGQPGADQQGHDDDEDEDHRQGWSGQPLVAEGPLLPLFLVR